MPRILLLAILKVDCSWFQIRSGHTAAIGQSVYLHEFILNSVRFYIRDGGASSP